MSRAKNRQTFGKHARERAVKERRALKLEKKHEAAALRLAEKQANGPAGSEAMPRLSVVPGQTADAPEGAGSHDAQPGRLSLIADDDAAGGSDTQAANHSEIERLERA